MRTLTLGFALTAGLLLAADEKALEGKWVATSLRQGETEAPKDEIDKGAITLAIDGERFTFRTPKETQEGTLKIDAKAKTIDLRVEKKGKAETVLCIYEWDGEALRIAGEQGKRPKDFRSKLGGSIVVRLKRAGR